MRLLFPLLLFALPLWAAPAPFLPRQLTEPDTSRWQRLGRPVTAADLARLKSVEGKPKAIVLRVLGHPYRVECWTDGQEVWDYPWDAKCRVRIRNGVCTRTDYTLE